MTHTLHTFGGTIHSGRKQRPSDKESKGRRGLPSALNKGLGHEQRTRAREHEQDTSTLQGGGLGKKPASKLRQALDELVVFKIFATHSLVVVH